MNERTAVLLVSYLGAGFEGWQRQEHGRTVQAELERALSIVLRRAVTVAGAGRTDAGVHALGQVASFPAVPGDLPPERLMRALNGVLARDVAVRAVRLVPGEFHARKHAHRKTYRYLVVRSTARPLLWAPYAFWHPHGLDDDAITAAAASLAGDVDCTCFRATGSSARTTVRTFFHSTWTRAASLGDLHPLAGAEGPVSCYTVSASGFLYKAVRAIVGTLLAVGSGKMTPERFKAVVAEGARADAGPTAPAHGLWLESVTYPEDPFSGEPSRRRSSALV